MQRALRIFEDSDVAAGLLAVIIVTCLGVALGFAVAYACQIIGQ